MEYENICYICCISFFFLPELVALTPNKCLSCKRLIHKTLLLV